MVQLYKHEWLKLPQETRRLLSEAFGIRKTEGVSIIQTPKGAVFESDGTSNNELKKISLETMKEFLGDSMPIIHKETPDVFSLLLELTIKKLYGQPVVASVSYVDTQRNEIVSGSLKRRPGRPPKKKEVVQGAA